MLTYDIDHCKWTFSCDTVQNVARPMTWERLKGSWNQFESITTNLNKTNPLPPTADCK